MTDKTCEECGSIKGVDRFYSIEDEDDFIDLCGKCARPLLPRCEACGRWIKFDDFHVVKIQSVTPHGTESNTEYRCPRCYKVWKQTHKEGDHDQD